MTCTCDVTSMRNCPEHFDSELLTACDKNVNYVCGFLFSPDYRHVVLIEKQRPTWQKGKLNGVGGKIELGENPAQAMRREFLEECGMDVVTWRKFVTLRGKGWCVHFFSAVGDIDAAKQMTDETPFVWTTDLSRFNLIVPNLKWLIPLALTGNTQGELYEQNEEASEAAKDRGSSIEHATGIGTANAGG